MKRNSGFMKVIEAIRRQDRLDYQDFFTQLTADCALIALNRAFGFGPDRLMRFCEELHSSRDEVIDIWNEDCKDRQYAMDKLDEALQQICGDNFIPWKERYNGLTINAKGELQRINE